MINTVCAVLNVGRDIFFIASYFRPKYTAAERLSHADNLNDLLCRHKQQPLILSADVSATHQAWSHQLSEFLTAKGNNICEVLKSNDLIVLNEPDSENHTHVLTRSGADIINRSWIDVACCNETIQNNIQQVKVSEWVEQLSITTEYLLNSAKHIHLLFHSTNS